MRPILFLLFIAQLFGCTKPTENRPQKVVAVESVIAQGTKNMVRNSEGDIVALDARTLFCAYTEFGYRGADDAFAQVAGKFSYDGGVTWGDSKLLVPTLTGLNNGSVSFLKLDGEIHLYFGEKISNTKMNIRKIVSYDQCKTWGVPESIFVESKYSPILNGVAQLLSNNRIAIPVYESKDCSYEFDPSLPIEKSYAYLIYSDDKGKSWRKSTPDITVESKAQGVFEPAIVEIEPGHILMTLRVEGDRVQYFSESTDFGGSFKAPYSSTLSSVGAPAKFIKLSNGALLSVHNPSVEGAKNRRQLDISQSRDKGGSWSVKHTIKDSLDVMVCYPSIMEHKGSLLLSYWHIEPEYSSLKFMRVEINSLNLE